MSEEGEHSLIALMGNGLGGTGMGEIGDLRGGFWRTIYPFLSGFGRSLFGPFGHCSCSVGGNGKKRKKMLLFDGNTMEWIGDELR